MKTKLPTQNQLAHARQLLSTRLFGKSAISMITGIPLVGIIKIAKTLPKDTPLPNPKKEALAVIRNYLKYA